jgi:hypothetical protein
MNRRNNHDAEVARLEHLLEQEHGRFNKFESEKFLQLEVDNWATGIRAGEAPATNPQTRIKPESGRIPVPIKGPERQAI